MAELSPERRRWIAPPPDSPEVRQLLSASSRSQRWQHTSTWWERWVQSLQRIVLSVLHPLSQLAVRNPWTVLSSTSLLSVALLATGLSTNFRIESDELDLWTLTTSVGPQQEAYLARMTHQPQVSEDLFAILHARGDSVLDAVDYAFDVYETLRNEDSTDVSIDSVTSLWNHSRSLYEMDEDRLTTLSAATKGSFLGKPVWSEEGRLLRVSSYITRVSAEDPLDLTSIEERLLQLRADWDALPLQPFVLEVAAPTAFGDELTRGILGDAIFVPMVFVAISLFTCMVFYHRHESRCLLGGLAVASVLLAIFSTYGLLFAVGIPLTALTQILPFVLFGVGVDDAYILSGAFLSTDRSKPTSDRVYETMEEAGLSIFLTSLTSSLAFAFGCLSRVPAIRWMCLYGCPGILFDFLLQVTFFVACIVLDERRIQARRMDCFVCCRSSNAKAHVVEKHNHISRGPCLDLSEQLVVRSARILFHPVTKTIVILLFSGLFAACAVSVTSLTQQFVFTDVLPRDSYVIDFYEAYEQYTDKGDLSAGVYFRDVNQTDPSIQDEMMDYYQRLTDGDDIEGLECWVPRYRDFLDQHPELSNLTIPQVLETAAAEQNRSYPNLFVLDDDGHILLSSCTVLVSIPFDDIQRQIAAARFLRHVTREQPRNEGHSNGPFFVYQPTFRLWESLEVGVDELVLVTVVSVSAVGLVSIVFLPQWTSALFLFPMLAVLYIDALGWMQLMGLHINALTTFILGISVGLLVDYVMHILFAYSAARGSRLDRAKTSLETMGPSVFLGGLSTLVGMSFLGFGQTEIFQTVFTMFLIIIVLGMAHGLILLPVVLSMIGPERRGGDDDETLTPRSLSNQDWLSLGYHNPRSTS